MADERAPMYMIQIEIEGGSACMFPAPAEFYAAVAVWQFMMEQIKPGRRVALIAENGQVVREGLSGDSGKLEPEFPG